MDIKLKDKNGATLHTAQKYIEEDINVVLDDTLIPSGTIDITTTDEYDVTNYATAKIKDDNLKPENIAENVKVLGLKGTFKGGIDTNDATATSDDLLLGKTAYVNDEKIEGTIETWDGTVDGEYKLYNALNDYLTGNKTKITKEDLAGITSMRERLFANQPITSVEFPDTLTAISRYAFTSCLALTELIIPSNVKRIEQGAFASSSLKTVKLLEGVTYIGVDSFQYCGSLENLELPSTLTTIERYAFRGSSKLMNIVCLAEIPPNIQATTFTNVPDNCLIKVPAGSVEAYKIATNWSERADYIVAYEEEE